MSALRFTLVTYYSTLSLHLRGLSVPPLPPKKTKRSSLYDNEPHDGTFPMHPSVHNNNNPHLSRSFSGSSMSVTSQQSDLSNTSSHSRPDSMHSTQHSSYHSDDWETSTTTTEQSIDMSRLSFTSGRSEGTLSPAPLSPEHAIVFLEWIGHDLSREETYQRGLYRCRGWRRGG